MQCDACGWLGYFDELESVMGYAMICPVCGEFDDDKLYSLYEPWKWRYRWFYRVMAKRKVGKLT